MNQSRPFEIDRGMPLLRDLQDRRFGVGRLVEHNERHAGLGDAGLLACDLGEAEPRNC
jgi:hypothetical protein